VKKSLQKLFPAIALACLGLSPGHFAFAQSPDVLVQVKQVRESRVERSLPLSGRVFSRNDASMSLTLSGELEWVLEPGTHVAAGEVIARLDQKPILLRKQELQHLAERERVNGEYLDKDLIRLRSLSKANNASERQVDEAMSKRDISLLIMRSIQAKIDQMDDELRRSQLVAPFAGVIAQRSKRGGEYARLGDVIARLVDLDNLELRFHVPVVYLARLATGDTIAFTAQAGHLSAEKIPENHALVRSVIPAANPSSQTFEVRADIDPTSLSEVIAGQLVNLSVPISGTKTGLQIPRDAIVLRAEGNYTFRISSDNMAQKVMIDVGEGSREWVSVKGELNKDDWVAIRGVERLQDGQKVKRIDS
jgi:RND family efflux transporter MFP subunit